MKKLVYTLGCILIGFVLATSTNVFADAVKSLIGKKVTGEYTVIVNGDKLADKGAIIDGKANVPVRGISDALGADIKVSGKTITVTTEAAAKDYSADTPTASNKYSGQSKQSIEEVIRVIKEHIIPLNESSAAHARQEIESIKKSGFLDNLPRWEKELADAEKGLTDAKADLALAEAALAAIE